MGGSRRLNFEQHLLEMVQCIIALTTALDGLLGENTTMNTGVRDEDVPTFAKCFHCGSCIGCSAFREFQYIW